jgi:hemin uptake protein HemP
MQSTIRSRTHQSADGRVTIGAQPPRRVTSTDLLHGERQLIIEHGDASYTLMLTRNSKLILTK